MLAENLVGKVFDKL